jgi:transcriptional regulator with XRE-family HTH domain
MSVGFKIKKLREEKKLSQPELANILDISQSDLSKIENGRTKKIDFQLMDKVCKEFNVDFEYFTEEKQTNNVKKNEGTIAYSIGTINHFPENIIDQIKNLITESKQKDEIIKGLREENKNLRTKK